MSSIQRPVRRSLCFHQLPRSIAVISPPNTLYHHLPLPVETNNVYIRASAIQRESHSAVQTPRTTRRAEEPHLPTCHCDFRQRQPHRGHFCGLSSQRPYPSQQADLCGVSYCINCGANVLLTTFRSTFTIYYTENFFETTVVNFDSSTALKLHDCVRGYKVEGLLKKEDHVRLILKQSIPTHGTSPLWPNLLTWLQHVHHGKQLWTSWKGDQPADQLERLDTAPVAIRMQIDVIRSMFTVAQELRDLPWCRTEKILESMRLALTKDGSRFGD